MRYLNKIFLVFATVILLTGAGKKEIKLTEGIQPGNLAPAINLQDVIFENKNDYVLLQFWAAYDPNSRIQNIQMHNIIKSKTLSVENLKLLSISMDESKSVFSGIVKADHLDESTQFNESMGRSSDLYKTFGLERGFGNWLINPSGMIIARNVNPDKLMEIVLRDSLRTPRLS